MAGSWDDGAADEREKLSAAEGVLLWSMRAWVLARCRSEDLRVESRIEAALETLDAGEAGSRLCGFMDAVERGGTRTVEVERLCARRLTPDERDLLGVFACAQSGQVAGAIRTLRGMVGPAAVEPALDRAVDVARALAGAGHAVAACRADPTPAPAALH